MPPPPPHTRMHIHPHLQTHMCMHTNSHPPTQIHPPTHAHTHTHTHTHTHKSLTIDYNGHRTGGCPAGSILCCVCHIHWGIQGYVQTEPAWWHGHHHQSRIVCGHWLSHLRTGLVIQLQFDWFIRAKGKFWIRNICRQATYYNPSQAAFREHTCFLTQSLKSIQNIYNRLCACKSKVNLALTMKGGC